MISLFRRRTPERTFQETVLEVIRVRYTGSFDTGKLCYCGGRIMDIATETARSSPSARQRLWGPKLPPDVQLDRFELEHRYECARCGFGYDPGHIRRLGYSPKEVLYPIPRSDEVNEETPFIQVA